jgi:hypothetical protein
VPTPLKFAHPVNPLPHKFKNHLPLFHGDKTVTVIEHLHAFLNACTILRVNNNDSCMLFLMNSLQGNATSLFSNLPNGCISTWFELSYWFTLTFGHLDNPYEHLKRFKQLLMKDSESILTFNLHFIKLYNLIPTLIHPTNSVSLLHYYEILPPLYRWWLEEKNVQNLELSLSTCLDFEEKISRTCYSFGVYDSHKDLSSLIPIIKILQDHMFFLESQSLNHTRSISWEPSPPGPNYNESTTCGQELGCEEDYDYIMMLNDQSNSHISNNTLLKPQSQSHLSFRAFYLHACDGEIDYTDKEIEVDHVKPIYDAFLFVDNVNECLNNVDQHDFNDAARDSSFEDIYEFNQDLNLYKFFSNPLFQSKEVKELGTIEHVPPRCTFYFDDSDYCRDIPMFVNSCYESSLYHDDLVLNRKVHGYDTNLFVEFMDHLFNVQTLNPKSNSINTFIITGK